MDQAKLDYFKSRYMDMPTNELVELQGNVHNMTEEAQKALSEVATYRSVDIVAIHAQQVTDTRASIDSELSGIEKGQQEGIPLSAFVIIAIVIMAFMFLGMGKLAESAIAVMTQGLVLALILVAYLYWRQAKLKRIRRKLDDSHPADT